MSPASSGPRAAGRSSGAVASPGPLVLLSGDEELLVDRAARRVVLAIRAVTPEAERRDATVSGLTAAEFADLTAPSLFAEPRVVVLRDAQDANKDLTAELLRYAAAPDESTTLVVHHSGAARNKPLADGLRKAGATVLTCARITRPAERLDFVRAEIREAGGRASPDAVAALVEAVGSDLRELAAAASQLVADSGGRVDETAVHRYYSGRAEVSGFAVADLAVAGDLPAALEALRWAMAIGVAPVLVADALADGVRTVAKVRGARPGSGVSLAGELGMPPWKIDKARGVARHWSPPALLTALSVVATVNADVKGAATDVEYALESAVRRIAELRGA
nr:DNA polymerase III subunit delta [Nakamurella leprariae]